MARTSGVGSSLVINDDLLVDIGPDIATASFQHQISLAGIGLCLQTHPHTDHLDIGFILARHAEYGTTVSGDLMLGGSDETLHAIDALVRQQSAYGSLFDPKTQSALKLKILSLSPFEAYRIEDYPRYRLSRQPRQRPGVSALFNRAGRPGRILWYRHVGAVRSGLGTPAASTHPV